LRIFSQNIGNLSGAFGHHVVGQNVTGWWNKNIWQKVPGEGSFLDGDCKIICGSAAFPYKGYVFQRYL
jgi:hypothetical protein